MPDVGPRSQHARRLLWLVTALWLSSGCGDTRDFGPPLGEVHGVVTYQGEPLDKATITFFPAQTGMRPAVGVTDARGRYQLRISGATSGAIVGACEVTIACREPVDGPPPEGVSPALAQELPQQEGEPRIPLKYFSAKTSGLTADVQPGHNAIDFELTD